MSISSLPTQPTTPENNTHPQPKFESNPLPDRHIEILARFCELFPDVDSTLAESLLKTVYVTHDRLSAGVTERIEGSDLFPHVILVDRQYFQVLTGNVGAGGNGAIVKGYVIPFDTAPHIEASPSKPSQVRVRKTSHSVRAPSFSPVKRVTGNIHAQMTPTKKTGFARYLDTSRSANGNPMALMPYYDGKNFAQTVFKDASDLITSFGLTARVLSGIHAQNKVHRDFKGLNVMHTDSGPVVVDPDGIKATYTTAAHTHGTPEFLNPRAFGSTSETLINQKNRWGLQRPCDDMYAFAVTGLNTLRRHLTRIVPKSETDVHTAINQLRPRYYTPRNGKLQFSDEYLKAYGEKFGYRAFFWERTRHQKTGKIMPERIGVYPSLEEYRVLIDSIFLNALISIDEAKLLEDFANLCVTIKHQSDEDRYDGLTAQQKCTEILSQKESSTSTATASSPIINRKRKRNNLEPQSLFIQDFSENPSSKKPLLHPPIAVHSI